MLAALTLDLRAALVLLDRPLRVLDLAPAVRQLPEHRLGRGVLRLELGLLRLQLRQLGLDRLQPLRRERVQPCPSPLKSPIN